MEPKRYPVIERLDTPSKCERVGDVMIETVNVISSIHPEWLPFFTNSDIGFNVRFRKIFGKAYQAKMKPAPMPHEVLTVFSMAPSAIKVVIVAQDPYPGWDRENDRPIACGRCFATMAKEVPGSLKRIQSSIMDVYGKIKIVDKEHPNSLKGWIDQGVFLLNNTPMFFISGSSDETVMSGDAKSTAKMLWQGITELICKHILDVNKDCRFILMGTETHYLRRFVNRSIAVNHPSPRSDLEFTGKCFLDTPGIDWWIM